jgi:hypothetical protein
MGAHKTAPLDATQTGWACSCGMTFSSDAGFAYCPNGPQPCKCYSCGGECGGNDDPGWCGPTVADAEGRPVCGVCRELATVWGDYRVGVKAAIDQDRVRVTVKFGESAWLNPASARALAAYLVARADELDAQLGTTTEATALAEWRAGPNTDAAREADPYAQRFNEELHDTPGGPWPAQWPQGKASPDATPCCDMAGQPWPHRAGCSRWTTNRLGLTDPAEAGQVPQ